MTRLLRAALSALGPAPSVEELARVGDALRQSGDRDSLDRLHAAATDDEAFKALARLASEAGATPFTALDLLAEVTADRG